MSHPLIARNEQLQRLVNDGYEVEIFDNHLVIRRSRMSTPSNGFAAAC
jgi:hypothetical protein